MSPVESSSEHGYVLGLSWKRSFFSGALSSASPMVMEREVISERVGTLGCAVDTCACTPSDVLVDGSRSWRDDSPVAP